MNYFSAFCSALYGMSAKKKYVFVTLAAAFLFFLALNWFSQFPLVLKNLFSPRLIFAEKLFFVADSLGIVYAAGGAPMAIALFSISMLFGLNFAFLAYYFSLRRSFSPAGGEALGFFGVLASALGAGCASCGTVLFSVLGISGAATLLPFYGKEFLALSALLLILSLGAVSMRIEKMGICHTSH